MAQTAPVFFDEPTDAAYYLGSDLLLVCAPTDRGRVQWGQGRVVDANRDNSELAARYAAIRVALLQAVFGSDEAWRSTMEDARARADELARAAGLASPPRLDDAQIRNVNLE